jgi:hypothetical protein
MDQNAGGDANTAHSRPLGRGLQDVSHLFLSRRSEDAARDTGAFGHVAEPEASAPPPPRGNAALLRPLHVTRDQLVAILPPDWSVALEEGLRTIDGKIPCHGCGEIDVLAVDRMGKLTIIDVDTTMNDGLLLRGLGHLDWVLRDAHNVQRMYAAHGVDVALPPRLILVAPQFSQLLRRVMRQVTRPQIQCLRYHAVDTPAGPWILFEPVSAD